MTSPNLITLTLDLSTLPAAISESIASVLRQRGLDISNTDALRELGKNVSAVVTMLDVGGAE